MKRRIVPAQDYTLSSQRRLGSRSLRTQPLCPVTNCHLSCPIYALSKELDSSLRWNDKVGHHRYWCLQAQQTTQSYPIMSSQRRLRSVIPAQAGIQVFLDYMPYTQVPHHSTPRLQTLVIPAQAGIQVFKILNPLPSYHPQFICHICTLKSCHPSPPSPSERWQPSMSASHPRKWARRAATDLSPRKRARATHNAGSSEAYD